MFIKTELISIKIEKRYKTQTVTHQTFPDRAVGKICWEAVIDHCIPI